MCALLPLQLLLQCGRRSVVADAHLYVVGLGFIFVCVRATAFFIYDEHFFKSNLSQFAEQFYNLRNSNAGFLSN